MTTPISAAARTPLHDWHVTHGARFITYQGWQIPAAYADAAREAEAARAGLGLADVSAFAKLSYRGAGVAALVADGLATKPRGVAWLRDAEPALACRLTVDHLLLLSLTGARRQLDAQGPTVVGIDATSAFAGFLLVGSRSEELLRRLTHLDVGPVALPVSSGAETSLAGVEALLVRTPELSLPAVRIYVAWDLGEYVWERLREAGRDFGLAPLGWEAIQALR